MEDKLLDEFNLCCKFNCKYRNTLEKVASLLAISDIDEDICKKVKCSDEDKDMYDCVDCIINFFSKNCEWNHDDVCVNDQSEWCADFVDSVKCGRCKYFE